MNLAAGSTTLSTTLSNLRGNVDGKGEGDGSSEGEGDGEGDSKGEVRVRCTCHMPVLLSIRNCCRFRPLLPARHCES